MAPDFYFQLMTHACNLHDPYSCSHGSFCGRIVLIRPAYSGLAVFGSLCKQPDFAFVERFERLGSFPFQRRDRLDPTQCLVLAEHEILIFLYFKELLESMKAAATCRRRS